MATGSDSLPRLTGFDLGRSLTMAERIAAQTERTTDHSLRRLLRSAECRLLDAALSATTDPHVGTIARRADAEGR